MPRTEELRPFEVKTEAGCWTQKGESGANRLSERSGGLLRGGDPAEGRGVHISLLVSSYDPGCQSLWGDD